MSAISRKQKTKAEAFLIEARNTVGKKTWFANSTEEKYENAAELYEKAANAFKVGGFHHEAGDAYRKAADLYQNKLKNLGEASKALASAGSCYKKSSPSDAVDAYRAAVSILCDAGRLTQAAKLSKQCGELFENEGVAEGEEAHGSNVKMAIESYEQAAELFNMEDSKGQAASCMTKVAELCSAALDPPELLRAAKIYDELGRRCLESNMLKFNAKMYFLQAIFCHLGNGDAIAGTKALQRYENLDYSFGESREGRFCRQLVEAAEAYDDEAIATASFEYDRITKLDPWKTSMLLKLKRSVEDQGGLGEDDDDVDLT